MRFARASFRDFRVYETLTLDLNPGVTVLQGPNAAGKTSVLEGLAVLATGRSFRGASEGDMVRHGSPGYALKARVIQDLGEATVEAAYVPAREESPSRKTLLVNGKPVNRAGDAAGRLPLVSFVPEDLALAKGGPSERRRFLDTLLLTTSPTYREAFSGYYRALAQRNALLADLGARRVAASSAAAQLDPWNESLAALGTTLLEERSRAVGEIAPPAAGFFADLDGGVLESVYVPSPFNPEDLTSELRRGVTLSGPHRDDLELISGGREVRRFASQGQQRSVVLALKLASLAVLERRTGEAPVLLLDDVLSELDPTRRAALLPLLRKGQALVTTTDRPALERALGERDLDGFVGEWLVMTGRGMIEVSPP